MAITTRERLAPLAFPFLEELMEVSQETVNLAIIEGNSTMYIEQATPPARMLRMFTEPGNRVPLHSTGTGKVLLAYQPPRLRPGRRTLGGPGDVLRDIVSQCGK